MKYPLLALTLGTLALVGCGSDDNTSEEKPLRRHHRQLKKP